MKDIPVKNNPLCLEARSFCLLLADIVLSECEIYSDIRYPGSYYTDAIEKLKSGFEKLYNTPGEWELHERYDNALGTERIYITKEFDQELFELFYNHYSHSVQTRNDKVIALLDTLKFLYHHENEFTKKLILYGIAKCYENFDFIRVDRILRHIKYLFDENFHMGLVFDFMELEFEGLVNK